MKLELQNIKNEAKLIAEKNDLSLVLLFGSQVREKTHAESDYDVAILGEKPFSPLELANFGFIFSRSLKIKEVDISDLKTLPPLLLKQIAIEGVALYEKTPGYFENFKIYAVKRYFEIKQLRDLRNEALVKFLKPA